MFRVPLGGRVALFFLPALLLGGCPGSGSGPVAQADLAVADLADLADLAPVPIDIAGLCARPDACTPCFANEDCPPTEHCHSFDDTDVHVYCVPGPRGPGAAGAACASEEDCASGLCIDSDKVGMLCSMLCDEPMATCPASLPMCLYVGFGVEHSICAPR